MTSEVSGVEAGDQGVESLLDRHRTRLALSELLASLPRLLDEPVTTNAGHPAVGVEEGDRTLAAALRSVQLLFRSLVLDLAHRLEPNGDAEGCSGGAVLNGAIGLVGTSGDHALTARAERLISRERSAKTWSSWRLISRLKPLSTSRFASCL